MTTAKQKYQIQISITIDQVSDYGDRMTSGAHIVSTKTIAADSLSEIGTILEKLDQISVLPLGR